MSTCNSKNFSGGYTPGPPLTGKGRGRKEGKRQGEGGGKEEGKKGERQGEGEGKEEGKKGKGKKGKGRKGKGKGGHPFMTSAPRGGGGAVISGRMWTGGGGTRQFGRPQAFSKPEDCHTCGFMVLRLQSSLLNAANLRKALHYI
jgi:hypothetical protein